MSCCVVGPVEEVIVNDPAHEPHLRYGTFRESPEFDRFQIVWNAALPTHAFLDTMP
jgi:hypothetical protein